MSRVRFRGVGFGYPDAPPLFHSLTLDLASGWTAIAGPNGEGKTTLLRLIAGALRPSAGEVRHEPDDPVIATCAQAPPAPTDAVLAFAREWDGHAGRLRARFGLTPEALERWATLSPGEQQRWQIAAALAAEPSVLLLDEPTNHLDAEARAALRAMLATFDGVGVIVAHDRAFLDAIATRTVWVEAGEARAYEGSYSDAREAMDRAMEASRRERAERRREATRVSAALDAQRRQREAADRSKSVRTRSKGPQDRDASSMSRKERARRASTSHAKAVAQLATQRDRANAALDAIHAPKERGRRLAIEAAATKGSVLRVALPTLMVGARVLVRATSVTLGRGERVRVAGPNGAGKSTLLRALIAASGVDPERRLYLPQELDRDARQAALARLRAIAPSQRARTMSLLAALGVDPIRLLASSEPSPGEARKLLLAEGLAREVEHAILDEPTNHLDVPSIERLEAALVEYPGALIVVTHDERFAARTTDVTWALYDGALHME